MFKHKKIAVVALTAALGAGALITAPSAHARSIFISPWNSLYPASSSLLNATPDGCQLCHNTASGSGMNAYGADLETAMASLSLSDALMAIEGDDSDSDPTGSSNIVEIDADTQPGWAEGDNPSGVIGDLDPVTPVADISVSPLSIDFGAVTVGTSGTDSVAISNVGSADLTVESLSLLDSNEFSLPGAPSTPFTVAANTSVNVSVEYAPLNEGLDNDTLEIASDSPGEELISVALSGTGVPIQVNECVPVVDPASLAFGSLELGNSLTLTTTVTNNGTLECAVEAAVASTIGEFSLASGAAFTVAPGDSADVSVAYTPADLGDDSGNLTLVFPDRTINVPLSGSGIEAPVEVLDLDIKSFRVTKKISLSRVKAVVIKLTVNNGGVTEGSAPATITGVQNGGVVHTQTLEVTDAVGNGSSRYTLEPFTPDAAGDIEWTMVIADGDPDDDVAIATTTVNP